MRIALALAAVLALAPRAAAHVVVLPANSAAGAAERYTLIVPTESESPTIRVELRLPLGMEIAAVEAKPGWQSVNRPFPIGGATIGWSGGSIPSGQMLSFDFLAVNPPAARVLSWNATQWYEDGTSDRWGEGAPEGHDASTTTLAASGDGHVHDHGHTAASGERPDREHAVADPHDQEHAVASGERPDQDHAHAGEGIVERRGGTATLWVSLLALVIAIAALLVGVRAGRRG